MPHFFNRSNADIEGKFGAALFNRNNADIAGNGVKSKTTNETADNNVDAGFDDSEDIGLFKDIGVSETLVFLRTLVFMPMQWPLKTLVFLSRISSLGSPMPKSTTIKVFTKLML